MGRGGSRVRGGEGGAGTRQVQSSGHSLEAVARPSHTTQYTEAVYFLRGKGGIEEL